MSDIFLGHTIEQGLQQFDFARERTGGELHIASIDPFERNVGYESSIDLEKGGYQDVDIAWSDLPNRPDLHGTVLLAADQERGLIPIVIFPASPEGANTDPNKFKMVRFDEPFDPSDPKGIDDGKLITLSYEAMTKNEAGYGSHPSSGSSGGASAQSVRFEGGHFGTASLAVASDSVASALRADGDDATHRIINHSVPKSFSGAKLLPREMPMPDVVDIDVGRLGDSRVKFRWFESMRDLEGQPLQANHPEASTILTGNVVMQLGSEGLDRVGAFIVDASRERER